jgi:outer membrane receptor protein involved in Fe transport
MKNITRQPKRPVTSKLRARNKTTMTHRSFLKVLGWSFCWLSLFAPRFMVVPAQSLSQTLAGRITDASGAALSGATVIARNDSTKTERTSTADTTGRFEIAGLAPGSYRVSVTATGFAPFNQLFTLNTEQNRQLEIQLVPGNVFETVTITAGETGYQPLSATTASRMDTPLRDLPAAVQIITRQVLDDQGIVTVNDAVRNASGVNVPHSTGSRAESFTIRGFTSIANTYRDGYRNDFNSNRSNTELSNVERVEVLKGPASVLFGRLDPSGVVNFVTKKPLADHHYSVQFQGGSFRFLRPQIDFAGPLTKGKNLLYRLNLAYKNADTFRDFNERERFFAAPSVNWIVGTKTTVLFEGEYLQDRRLVDRGLVSLPFAGGIAPIPFSRFLGDRGKTKRWFVETSRHQQVRRTRLLRRQARLVVGHQRAGLCRARLYVRLPRRRCGQGFWQYVRAPGRIAGYVALESCALQSRPSSRRSISG